MKYNDFIKSKEHIRKTCGFEVSDGDLFPDLMQYQKDMVKFCCRNAKSGIFTMTGTGKTWIQTEFARQIHEKKNCGVLIVAPLAVSDQTIREAKKLDIKINSVRKHGQTNGIDIINYERLHQIDITKYNAVILDEASIIKNYSGTIRNQIISMFQKYDYKAAFSATPSPNDYMELGNYSEFLDVMKRAEMLSTFFIHDSAETQSWRLKGHAENDFWSWLSSYCAMMMYPSDLGYDEKKFVLPNLYRHEHKIIADVAPEGYLFPIAAKTLDERRAAKKATIDKRVAMAAELVNSSNDIWICWCNYNDESAKLKKSIPGAVEITGSNSDEEKEDAAIRFANGEIKCLVSKPSIFGFGLNFQVCHNQTFFPDDSFEQFFQAEKRTYRFGQKQDVHSHLIYSDIEGNIMENLKRKELQFYSMLQSMIEHTKHYVKENLEYKSKWVSKYDPQLKMLLPEFLHG